MNNLFSLVEILEQELESKTGIFFNPKIRNAWELDVQDGELIIEIPNFSFQVSP